MSDYALAISEAEVARYRMMAANALLLEAAQLRAAGVVDGAVVADIGCGPAAMSVAIAAEVGPSGRVLAIERDAQALDQAIVDHLATLTRPGGSVYLVDVDLTAVRLLDADPDLDDLSERYVRFHVARGNDPIVGLRLGKFLRAAGLEVLSFTGSYNIIEAPPGIRPPSWAARSAMVAEGAATTEDVDRWDAAFQRSDAAATRPQIFAPGFVAVGRRAA